MNFMISFVFITDLQPSKNEPFMIHITKSLNRMVNLKLLSIIIFSSLSSHVNTCMYTTDEHYRAFDFILSLARFL